MSAALDIYMGNTAAVADSAERAQIQSQYQQRVAAATSLQAELQRDRCRVGVTEVRVAPTNDSMMLTMRLETADQRIATLQAEVDRAKQVIPSSTHTLHHCRRATWHAPRSCVPS